MAVSSTARKVDRFEYSPHTIVDAKNVREIFVYVLRRWENVFAHVEGLAVFAAPLFLLVVLLNFRRCSLRRPALDLHLSDSTTGNKRGTPDRFFPCPSFRQNCALTPQASSPGLRCRAETRANVQTSVHVSVPQTYPARCQSTAYSVDWSATRVQHRLELIGATRTQL